MEAIEQVPKADVDIPYGTAGFRTVSNLLDHVAFRVTFAAALRSAELGAGVGVMITASHNPGKDNGIKLIDPDGGMLNQSWEPRLTALINSHQASATFKKMKDELDLKKPLQDALIIVGCDTRTSSPHLVSLVLRAVNLVGCHSVNFGEVTTPQLHFCVKNINEMSLALDTIKMTTSVLIKRYFNHFHDAVKIFLPESTHSQPLTLCVANGVGGKHISGFRETIKYLGFDLHIENDADSGKPDTGISFLNEKCGAEFVQKTQQLPAHFSTSGEPYGNWMAFDGDADRLVAFTVDEHKHFRLIDGDRLACVYLKVIVDLISKMAVAEPLDIGFIQTAYANGASTKFAKALMDHKHITGDVCITKTGVKHLHHKAQYFSIAVYFESNGHGTVVFKEDNLTKWATKNKLQQDTNYIRLLSYLRLFNETTGDAMTDLIAYLAALDFLNWNVHDVLNMYHDLLVFQDKIHMTRAKLNTLKPHQEHELWLIEPNDLQEKINDIIAGMDGGRAFIRPSGTEDVVRLYIEGEDKKQVSEANNKLLVLLNSY